MEQESPRVLALMGSPRRNGNTARVLGWVLEELTAHGCSVERVDVADYELEGCIACYQCQKKTEGLFCSRKDRGLELLGKLIEADTVIYATPLYCWSWSGRPPHPDPLPCGKREGPARGVEG